MFDHFLGGRRGGGEGGCKLSVSAAASDFCEQVQVVIDLYNPHRESSLTHPHGFQLLLLLQ